MERRTKARKGGILVIAAASMVVLMGAAAWVVDMGSALQSRTHQQAAADAGALAAAIALLPVGANETTARASAVNLVGQNGFVIGGDKVTFWNHPSGRRAVTVSWVQPSTAYFSTFFGKANLPVYVSASAILGNLNSIPGNVLPFAVPAYKDGNGDWWVLSSTNMTDYRRMTESPPTQMTLKVDSSSNKAGNFLALGLDGTGGNVYKNTIVNGATTPLKVGDVVYTETGNLVGPTKQGIADRLAKPNGAEIVVPLISKTEWDAALGHDKVTIIGFVSAHIDSITGQSVITATFKSHVYPGEPTLGQGAGAGGYAPMLIDGAN